MTTKDTNPKDAIGSRKWRNILSIPKQVLWELGLAMLEGGVKYGRHNYRVAGVRASVYLDAAYGHLFQWEEGEDIDKDSGLSHITKAIASLVVLRDAMMNDFFVDDRPPKVKGLDALRDRLQKCVDNIFERHPEPVAPYTAENSTPYDEPTEEDVEGSLEEDPLVVSASECMFVGDNVKRDIMSRWPLSKAPPGRQLWTFESIEGGDWVKLKEKVKPNSNASHPDFWNRFADRT